MTDVRFYRRHRFPPHVIARAVWLYFRFPLSLRMIEDLLAERGIIVIGKRKSHSSPKINGIRSSHTLYHCRRSGQRDDGGAR